MRFLPPVQFKLFNHYEYLDNNLDNNSMCGFYLEIETMMLRGKEAIYVSSLSLT